jgi:hypothetical protein
MKRSVTPVPRLALGLLALSLAVRVASAQDLSGRRLGPLTASGEVTGSYAPEDTAFFNDTGYDVATPRLLWVGLNLSLRLDPHLHVLTQVVSENLETLRLRALYLRYRPFRRREIDVQAGRIPPVFGAFGRRSYGVANPLIGLPLGYQYLTTLRTDAMPASADDLLRVRGRGWRVRYPVGSQEPAPGLPLVQSRYWDTGIEARFGREPLSLAVAVTQGSLSEPRLDDDNGGKQVSARAQWTPRVGLVLGVSGARGEYVDRSLLSALPADQASRRYRQRAFGADVEYSWGHWLVRGEAMLCEWDVPELEAPRLTSPLEALSLSAEGVRKLMPGLYLAARVDHLGFSRVTGTAESGSWDAPVTRVEGGAGWEPWRPLTLRVVYQYNWRSAGPRGRHGLVSVQAGLRF